MNTNVKRCWLVGLSILAVVAVAASLLFMTDYSHKTYRSIEFSARLAYQSEGREDPITRELLSVDPSTNVRSNTTLKVLHSKVPTKVSTLHKVRDNLQRGAIKSMLYSYTNSNVSVLVVNRSSIIPYDGKNRESTKISATNKDGTEARDNTSKTKLVASILQSLSDDHLQSVPKELVALASDYNFSLPCPGVYKPTGEVMQSFWVKPLLQILSKFASKQVTLVIANRAYEDILLNWLISATITTVPPIKNILVVALDEGLHYRLRQRGIPSIYAAAVSLFEHRHRFRRYFEIVMMTRLLFMRIINRLGFDCAMYDIDAIILKNPKPLYDTYATDIVGSRGALPKLLLKKWFVTICIGAVLIRSNERTEKYWAAVRKARLRKSEVANDQIRLNYGLDVLNIRWSGQNYIVRGSEAVGHCYNGPNVTVLPYSVICRYDCRPQYRSHYYIWHKGGDRDKKSKIKGAAKGHTWFLKEDWKQITESSSLRGTEWLRLISNS